MSVINGVLLLHPFRIFEENICQYALGWWKRTEEKMKEIFTMYRIKQTCDAQVNFKSLQEFQIVPHIINRPKQFGNMNNTPEHWIANIGWR